MTKLISLDEFRAAAQKDGAFREPILRLATGSAAEVAGETRTLRFCFSDGSVDRSGDRIDPKGWDLAQFLKNSVALWAHNSWDPPIGRAKNVSVVSERLMGDIEFAPVETYAFADTVYRLAKDGFINAVSVGFIPREWSFTNEKERPYGIDFKQQELLEISVCPVPCNANALIDARAKGIDTRSIMEWAEKVLDEGNAVMMPRATLEQIFKDARTPHSAREKYRGMFEQKASDWKCSASSDLPIDENSAWDGPAAEKSIFDACGFDGDKPDTARAAQHFLAHDASAPELKGSYKLPFAKITDGKSEAVASGLHAASSRLSGTDIPDGVKESAQGVIDHYKAKMGDKAWRKAAGEGTGDAGGDLVPTGNCGKAKGEECGMKDPQMCMIHAPEQKTELPEEFKALLAKAGRRISAANRATLQEALDHHEKCAKCIRDVMDSDEPDEQTDPKQPAAEDIDESLDPAEQRRREARALKDEINKI